MRKSAENQTQKQGKNSLVKAIAFHFKTSASPKSSFIATEYNASTAVPAFPCKFLIQAGDIKNSSSLRTFPSERGRPDVKYYSIWLK